MFAQLYFLNKLFSSALRLQLSAKHESTQTQKQLFPSVIYPLNCPFIIQGSVQLTSTPLRILDIVSGTVALQC